MWVGGERVMGQVTENNTKQQLQESVRDGVSQKGTFYSNHKISRQVPNNREARRVIA